MNDRLLSKLKKLMAIVNGSQHPGERNSAQSKVEAYLKQHGLTLLDLDDVLSETVTKPRHFRYNTSHEKTILTQLFCRVLDKWEFDCWVNSNYTRLTIHCTDEQAAEIAVYYEVIKRDLNEQLKDYVSAFINKNQLFPPTDEYPEKWRSEGKTDPRRAARVRALRAGIEASKLHKLLE